MKELIIDAPGGAASESDGRCSKSSNTKHARSTLCAQRNIGNAP